MNIVQSREAGIALYCKKVFCHFLLRQCWDRKQTSPRPLFLFVSQQKHQRMQLVKFQKDAVPAFLENAVAQLL